MAASPLRPAHEAVDHLILAAATLADAAAFVRAQLGVEARRTGANPAAGTEHARVALGARCYLELVAPAPGEAFAPALAAMAALERPRLWGWALSVSASGPDIEGSHVRRRNLAVQLALGAAAPLFVEWSAGAAHPADDAPPAGRLRALTVLHPDPDAARAALARFGVALEVTRADAPAFTAELESLAGEPVALA